MKRRLYSLDLLRGLDMFYLLVVHYGLLVGGVFKIWPLSSPAAKALLMHSPTAFVGEGPLSPSGFGLLDFAQPLFIFVTGVSAALAMTRFLGEGGGGRAAFWKRLLARTALLWACGSLIRGALTFRLFSGPAAQPSFCLFSDTLHTIAVAYFAASVSLLVRRVYLRALAAAALLALPAAVLALCGDYTRLGNAARLIEEAVYSRLGGGAKDFCYLLTTFTWAGMGVLSSFAGELVKSALSPGRKAAFLAAGGAASLGVGLVLSAWIPPIRYIYTLSFVFETLGLSALLFAGLYALYDLLAFRRGTWLLILFGQCSLAAWMLVNFFGKALEAAGECLVAGVPNLLGADAARPLFVQVAKAAVLVWLIWQWRRLRGRRPSAAAAEQLSNGQGERE